MLTVRPRAARDERGAVAILVSLVMVTMLIIAGMVLDFGLVRLDRQQNKSAADAAATAGALTLAAGAGSLQGACVAIDYLATNNADLRTLRSYADPGCSASSPGWTAACPEAPVNMVITQIPNYRIQIQTPYVLPTDTPYDSLNNDPGDPSAEGCDQIAVTVQKARQPGLGSLATSGDLVSAVTSVARGVVNPAEKVSAVALLLEQTRCNALSISGGTSRFWVKPALDASGAEAQGGMVHSDSDGSTTSGQDGCSGNARILVGQHSEGIKAIKASNDLPGIVETRNLAIGTDNDLRNGSANFVVAEGSTPRIGGLVTRQPVDLRYRRSSSVGINNAMMEFEQLVPSNFSDVAPGNSNNAINCPTPDDLITATGTQPAPVDRLNLRIRCNANASQGWNPACTSLTLQAEYLWIDAKAFRVPSGCTINLPNLKRLYVTGDAAGGIDNSGTLRVGTSGDTCAAGGNTSRVLVGDGGLSSAGTLRFCRTTAILINGDHVANPYLGCVPAGIKEAPQTLVPAGLPATACAGVLSVTGITTWTAPNEVTGGEASQAQYDELEDLAFWSEAIQPDSGSGGVHTIQGSSGDSVTMSGVFFAPSSRIKFFGQANFLLDNAQFIARSISVEGGSQISIQPNQYDSVPIPSGFSSVLIR